MATRKTYELPDFQWSNGRPLIEMNGITKYFHTAAGDFPVLKEVSVKIKQGEFVSVVGRSGSGKSTLVNMITGIDHPTSGKVRVGDTTLHTMPEGRMSVWRGKHLGIVFQFFQLLPMLTIIENVMLPMDFCNMYSPADREERAMRLLKRVGLDDLAHKLPAAISGGQQQSAAVARALANDPPIIIADEPTGNLDSKTAEDIMQLFEELESQGKTLLMVTHDSSLAKRTSRTLLISDGEMVNEGVMRLLPNLPHEEMLRLTHLGKELVVPPGEPVSPPSALKQPVYIISDGQLELFRKATPQNPETFLKSIPTYQYFNPRLSLNGSREFVTLKAGQNGPLTLLAFEQDDLDIPVKPISAEAPIPPQPPQKPKGFFARLWRSQ